MCRGRIPIRGGPGGRIEYALYHVEGVLAPKTPISTANRSKSRVLFGIILTCLNRELVFLLPKVKKREYFEFAWAHWALKVIDSNGSHIGEGRIAYALHSVQTVNSCVEVTDLHYKVVNL